jgi:signal transduction histidine kinase
MAWEDALHLSEMINDLLDLAKIERGKLEPDRSRVNLTEQIAQIEASYRGHIWERGLTLTLELPAEPLFAWCDPAHYRRVVTNLLSNSIKFTHKGGQIFIKVEPVPEGMIMTSVRDNGIGIPREQQHRLFGRFEQVRRPGAGLIVGTGLGLSLCKQLVELNGGTIGFESEENRGSRFYFTLPAGETPHGEGVQNTGIQSTGYRAQNEITD